MPGRTRRDGGGPAGGSGDNRDRRDRRDGGRGGAAQDKTPYIERLVTINRVAKVVKGGRRFSFTALMIVGDGDGLVGDGYGKAKEVPAALADGGEESEAHRVLVAARGARKRCGSSSEAVRPRPPRCGQSRASSAG